MVRSLAPDDLKDESSADLNRPTTCAAPLTSGTSRSLVNLSRSAERDGDRCVMRWGGAGDVKLEDRLLGVTDKSSENERRSSADFGAVSPILGEV